MKSFFFSFLIILTGFAAQAQAPEIEWQKSYGGTNDEEARSIQQTADGGYIIAGASSSDDGDVSGNHGNSDCWIVKLDDAGGLQWQKSFGGGNEDYAWAIQQTADGGYIVAGGTKSNDDDVSGNHGGFDCWIVKLNDTGNIEWQRPLGGTSSDFCYSIQQTADGGYIVAGDSGSFDGDAASNHGNVDCWIVKLNDTGAIQWQKSLGGMNNDLGYSIRQTTDGGYIVVGFSTSGDGDVSGNHGGSDYWVVKLNDAGNIQWQRSLGGSNDDFAYSVRQTADGGYIVAGESNSNDGDITNNHGDDDSWIVKLEASGAIEWQRSFGGSDMDYTICIQQTTDGGYIASGRTMSHDGNVSGNHGGSDYWIIKLSSSGGLQWQKALGGTGDGRATSIWQTTDGGYIIAGSSTSDDGDVSGNHGGSDYWIVKLSGTTGINDTDAETANRLLLYPNPNKGSFILEGVVPGPGNYTLTITDVSAQQVYKQHIKISAGNTLHREINTGNLPPGVYFLHLLKDNESIAVKKFTVE